ncbi:protein kinase domain containing protein [Stylonychia lemnae]|uniref:Protein kinase domain containing protein n=1 Tax=Stylonychia lemnae TaxID=5949 RepID=A0A078AIU0_STYLE|nr:protein kinase domain containing protein [Stylonychia lemnae]|eukprot:CDW81372.1 protein kinase domain containing protein [Stylonychia lemnae]
MGSILSSCCMRNSYPPAPFYPDPGRGRLLPGDQLKNMLTSKDFRGFKKVDDINKHYTFFNTLGQGSFGKVMKAEHMKASADVAVKIIEKSKVREHKILEELMQNELKVLEETTHPHIMKIIQLLEDEDHYYIVSELLAGGELYERIVKMKHFSEKNAAILTYQILLAVSYMHNQNIVHRDIKPENILLENEDVNNLNVKMTDFGFACFFDPAKGVSQTLGSPLYMAPEIIQEKQYDQRVDIWSIGVIVYILLSGRPPFRGKSKPEIFKSILHHDLSFDHEIWDKISQDAKDFIRLALQKDHTRRANAKDLLDHAWIIKHINNKQVTQEVQLDVINNLREFRNAGKFQVGVLSFLVSMKTSSEELEELKQLFLQLDTSKDGTLSIEEIQQGINQLKGKLGNSRIDYKDMMASMDQDGNGVVDYTEFITAAIDKVAILNKKNLISAFQSIDLDNNGSITIDELKQCFDNAEDKKDESLWQELMNEVDKNNDNLISFDEFTEAMTEMLKKKHLK